MYPITINQMQIKFQVSAYFYLKSIALLLFFYVIVKHFLLSLYKSIIYNRGVNELRARTRLTAKSELHQNKTISLFLILSFSLLS